MIQRFKQQALEANARANAAELIGQSGASGTKSVLRQGLYTDDGCLENDVSALVAKKLKKLGLGTLKARVIVLEARVNVLEVENKDLKARGNVLEAEIKSLKNDAKVLHDAILKVNLPRSQSEMVHMLM